MSTNICKTIRNAGHIQFGLVQTRANLVDLEKQLQHEPSVVNTGLDTAEKRPSKVRVTNTPLPPPLPATEQRGGGVRHRGAARREVLPARARPCGRPPRAVIKDTNE